MAISFSCVAGISAPLDDFDKAREFWVREFQRDFVRGASHAGSEVESTSVRNSVSAIVVHASNASLMAKPTTTTTPATITAPTTLSGAASTQTPTPTPPATAHPTPHPPP